MTLAFLVSHSDGMRVARYFSVGEGRIRAGNIGTDPPLAPLPPLLRRFTGDPYTVWLRDCSSAHAPHCSSHEQVVASLGHRVVAWSLSGTRNDYWRVHSSLLLPEDQHVTALNCVSGNQSPASRCQCLTRPRSPRRRDAVHSFSVYPHPRE